MRSIRTLIVDDSVVFRSQIRAAVEAIPRVVVTGTANTGKIALQKLLQESVDLIILDLEMPEMGGLELLHEMRERGIHSKIIVFSSFSERGAESTLDALRLGASDFVTKPTADDPLQRTIDPSEKIRSLLSDKILSLFQEEAVVSTPVDQQTSPNTSKDSVDWSSFTPNASVIGSSTGGPNALDEIFSRISGPVCCPILIVQHMPPLFTANLAERIGKISGIPAAEGKHFELLQPNRIYVAPGGFHMRLTGSQGAVRIILDQGPLEHSVRPAVDPLFVSASQIFGHGCLGIILTGMGEDGKVGSKEIKNAGGRIMIQDRKSSVVFGMPGAVYADGNYDQVADPKTIANHLHMISGIDPMKKRGTVDV
jgi:two-component system chemotaxis response regulator CheB